MKKVSVFGSAKCIPGDIEYEAAYKIRQLLGEAGFSVATGGYQGTMEAVSKGASEYDVEVTGCIVPNLFQGRSDGNQYLSNKIVDNNLSERIGSLIKYSNIIIVLPGTIGTLTELFVVWNQEFIKECNDIESSYNIYLHDSFWRPILEGMSEKLKLPLNLINYFSDENDLIKKIVN